MSSFFVDTNAKEEETLASRMAATEETCLFFQEFRERRRMERLVVEAKEFRPVQVVCQQSPSARPLCFSLSLSFSATKKSVLFE